MRIFQYKTFFSVCCVNIPLPLKQVASKNFSETAMNLAGESVDGESASQFVAAENDIEDIFFEAEENDGSNWKARGKLPVLVLFNALNWASNFPSIPTVIRGPLADTLCDLSPQVKAFWNHGHALFESFKNRYDAVVHATSSGLDNKGFEGSRTVSFELSDDCVRVDVPPYISVDSKALLAIKGPWFTSGHIESAGAVVVSVIIWRNLVTF